MILEKIVDQSLIDEFTKKNNIPFISTSAKKNNNINELFEQIGKQLYLNFNIKGNIRQTTIKINSKKKKHRCC